LKLNELKDTLLVRSGLVAIVAAEGSARRQILALRYPNELILPFNASRNVTVEAILQTDLAIAPVSAFHDALLKGPKMSSVLAQVLGRERAIACEWIARCGLSDSAGRLAHVLCETFFRMGVDPNLDRLTLPFTQQQLAEMTGQTQVHVNRMLAHLEGQNLIARNVRDLIVKDWAELSRVGRFDPIYLD
jgi:CRP-like cAMP-binding protein